MTWIKKQWKKLLIIIAAAILATTGAIGIMHGKAVYQIPGGSGTDTLVIVGKDQYLPVMPLQTGDVCKWILLRNDSLWGEVVQIGNDKYTLELKTHERKK